MAWLRTEPALSASALSILTKTHLSLVVKSVGSELDPGSRPSSVTLGQLVNPPEPHFPHQKRGITVTVFLSRVIVRIKC